MISDEQTFRNARKYVYMMKKENTIHVVFIKFENYYFTNNYWWQRYWHFSICKDSEQSPYTFLYKQHFYIDFINEHMLEMCVFVHYCNPVTKGQFE